MKLFGCTRIPVPWLSLSALVFLQLNQRFLVSAEPNNATNSDFSSDDLCHHEDLLKAASYASRQFCIEKLLKAVPEFDCSDLNFEVIQAAVKEVSGTREERRVTWNKYQGTVALSDKNGKCLIAFDSNIFVPLSSPDDPTEVSDINAMRCEWIPDLASKCTQPIPKGEGALQVEEVREGEDAIGVDVDAEEEAIEEYEEKLEEGEGANTTFVSYNESGKSNSTHRTQSAREVGNSTMPNTTTALPADEPSNATTVSNAGNNTTNGTSFEQENFNDLATNVAVPTSEEDSGASNSSGGQDSVPDSDGDNGNNGDIDVYDDEENATADNTTDAILTKDGIASTNSSEFEANNSAISSESYLEDVSPNLNSTLALFNGTSNSSDLEDNTSDGVAAHSSEHDNNTMASKNENGATNSSSIEEENTDQQDVPESTTENKTLEADSSDLIVLVVSEASLQDITNGNVSAFINEQEKNQEPVDVDEEIQEVHEASEEETETVEEITAEEEEEDESVWEFAGKTEECSRFGVAVAEGIVFKCGTTAYVCGESTQFQDKFLLLLEDPVVDGCDLGETKQVHSSRGDCNMFPKNEHYLKRDGKQKEDQVLYCPNGETLSSYYMFCSEELDNYFCNGDNCETCEEISRQRRQYMYLRH